MQPMFGLGRTRTQHRRFTYQPRFHDTKRDDRVRRKIRVSSHRRRGRQPAFILLALLLLAAVYVYTRL